MTNASSAYVNYYPARKAFKISEQIDPGRTKEYDWLIGEIQDHWIRKGAGSGSVHFPLAHCYEF